MGPLTGAIYLHPLSTFFGMSGGHLRDSDRARNHAPLRLGTEVEGGAITFSQALSSTLQVLTFDVSSLPRDKLKANYYKTITRSICITEIGFPQWLCCLESQPLHFFAFCSTSPFPSLLAFV